MATTDVIIDRCLKGIGEEDPDNPVEMTRAEVLDFINEVYQGPIARRLRLLTSYTYDASDADHTITAGVGTLPSDFLEPSRVYDGDAPDEEPLDQIFDIKDKVDDTDDTSQYMLPNMSEIWVFGTTPTNDIKLYYYFEPTALTDSSASTPTYLKKEFHIKPFEILIKRIYEFRNSNNQDVFDMETYMQDILTEIEDAHSMRDDADHQAQVVW